MRSHPMRKSLWALLLLAVLAVPGLTWANDATTHVLGKVTAADASHLELTTKDGKTISVLVTPDTRFMKAGAAAVAEDVKVGTRVVVDTVADGDTLRAKEVTIGAAGYGHKKKE